MIVFFLMALDYLVTLASINVILLLSNFWSSQWGSNPRSRAYEATNDITVPGGSPPDCIAVCLH
jgi:hypothetical protein